MANTETRVIDRSLFSWIWPGNALLQLLALVIIVLMVFVRVLPLEMQKRIVNEAIELKNFQLLLIYCGIYLAAVILASALKFLNSLVTTLIAQRTTARMRKALYRHILNLPLPLFRSMQPGMVVNSLNRELARPGIFIGTAVARPAADLLTLLFVCGYLFWLHPLLAVVSFATYLLIVVLVPLLQRKVNRASIRHVDLERTFSNRISEAVNGIHEIQGHGAHRLEARRYDRLVERLMQIDIVLHLYRFAIKSVNTLFSSLGPFIVFILGGYFAINGQLELGALVAFISAQGRLYEPWKELIDFYQVYQDSRVTYKRTMDSFKIAPLHALEHPQREASELEGSIQVQNVSFEIDPRIRLLDGVSFTLRSGEHMALVGSSGSGKSTLAHCLAQLYPCTQGSISFDGSDIAKMSKQEIAQNVGFVAQHPFLFEGTIEENLRYACAAQKAGNGSDTAEHLPSPDDLIAVLQQTGLFVDVLQFGFNTLLVPGEQTELAQAVVRVRQSFLRYFGDELADHVEFFEENNYLYYSSILENLTFGAPNQDDFSIQQLPTNAYFLEFLAHTDLKRPLLTLGAQLCRQTVEILGSLPEDPVFFEQSPISPHELDEFKVLAEQLKHTKLYQLNAAQQAKLLQTAFRFTPGVHKIVALPQLLESLILEGRALFLDLMKRDYPNAFSFYRRDAFIYSHTIQSNILFGKTKVINPQVQEKINQRIIQLLIEEDFLETIIFIGLQYNVGSGGGKLSGGQRQKIAIARAFLKEPKILIMDEATSGLDNKSQDRIQNILESRWKEKCTLLAVVHRLDTVKNYDRIAVMQAGRIAEMGTYADLIEKKGQFYELAR